MTREEIENVSPEVEMLARMWIECDPNRVGGISADEPYTLFIAGHAEDHPRWKWFLPRARASIEFLQQHGYTVTASQPN